jgi:hypothetical protein
MEQTALILIVLTLFLLVVIVGLLTVLIYKLFRQKSEQLTTDQSRDQTPHPDISRSDMHPGILERIKSLEKIKPKRPDLFCPNHAEEPGETVCAICDRLYCKACIKPYKTMHFCKEHLPLVMRYDWEEALTIKTSTHDPEQGVRLYEFKKEIFLTQDVPTYIETHYKINVDQDFIETYLVLYGIKENVAALKAMIPEHLKTQN